MPENKLPSYEELFGNLDYSSADQYRSVLSPAAYLTDIMDLKNWNYGQGEEHKDAVDDRRDDISEIPLNAENTITEIPHLDVVNQIMENRVKRIDGVEDAYESLKVAKFPFNLPFNQLKAEINLILEYFKTDPHRFYKAFTTAPETKIEAREYLGLGEEEYQDIIEEVTGPAAEKLKAYYGLKSDESLCDLSHVTRFRKAAELSALQVTELLFQNLSDEEKSSGMPRKFFINRSSSVNGYLIVRNGETDANGEAIDECVKESIAKGIVACGTDEDCKKAVKTKCINQEYLFVRTISANNVVADIVPPNDYFDRIHRFIRLSRKTGFSFADLDLILVKACNGVLDEGAIKIIATVKWLHNTYEIPVEEVCAFFSAIKDYGKGETTTSADLLDRIFNNGYDKKIDDPAVVGAALKNRIRAGLGCSESEYNAIEEYLRAAGKNIEPTPSRLALPYRIKKLATLFEIPVQSLFTLFGLINKNYLMIDKVKFPLPVGFEQTIQNCRDIITIEEIAGPDWKKAIENILWLVQLTAVFMQWLNDNEMTVEQLEFICTEHSSSTVEGVLNREETKDLFRDLDGQFRAVLFKAESLLSGVTDKLTADLMYEKICDLETGVCTDRGIIRSTTANGNLLSLYLNVIEKKLFIEPNDLAKTGLPSEGLTELFGLLQSKNYIDAEGYVSNTGTNIAFFTDPANAETFLQGTDFSTYAAIVFKEVSERVKAYSRAKYADESEYLLPLYLAAIKEKLFIEKDDLAKTELSDADLTELFRLMQNMDYIDLDGYVDNADANFAFFTNAANVEVFLHGTDFSAYAAIVFKEIAERVKSYSKAKAAAESESAAIAEKISVQAARQQAVLLGALEGGLNVSSDIVKILYTTIFRTPDETEEMATVRFMTPLMEAFDREAAGGELVFDASLVTSFRRLQQFSLLVSKTELKARELEVLFFINDVQKALPEKLKLPAPFSEKIDAMYSDAEGNLYIFSGNQYIRFSGTDYSFDTSGNISELLPELPDEFKTKINAAIRAWAPDEQNRKTYFFAGGNFVNAGSPNEVKPAADYWGKVRNHIAENNRVDAAYRANDGKLYLFSDDQYVRYSGASREYVDEGYPKNILRNWNNENQIQLPFEIREKVDSIFIDTNGKTYFFSKDKFLDSSDAPNVQKTKDRWARVVNNIIDNNKVDDVLVKDGKTYLFSGDQYTRYSSADYSFTDEGYPKKIANNWNNEGIKKLSGEYLGRIDAALNGTDNQVYLFNGTTFISTENNEAPAQVNEKWGRVLNNIKLNNRVDAALVKEGKTYLFSGDQYYRYSGPDYTVLDEGYPKKISSWNARENSGTLPPAFNSGISAAVAAQDSTSYFFSENKYISSKPEALPGQVKDAWARVRNNIQANNKLDAGFVAPDGKTYLFSGDQFFRYSSADYTVVDEGYPKKIRGNWGDLPDSFCQKIDAAFRFNFDGTDRLYLFSGSTYVRYSGSNYSQIDAGYPKELDNAPNPEGNWFEPIFESNPQHQYNDRIIKTIFTDQFNNKPRINYFFYDKNGVHKMIRYEYINNKYHWSNAIPVSSLTISPFTSVDVGFSGADNKVYLFSGNNFAAMKGNYAGITTPALINGTWGKVLNRFHDLNRIDATFRAANGSTYLFCDDQYAKYSGNITPEDTNFFVDEGYPKKIQDNWNSENGGIPLPAAFKPEGYALLAAPDGMIYRFTEGTFVTSSSQQPVPVNEVWGKVKNNFESLNRVDAAFVHDNKTYLFCGDQYTRYSGNYSVYSDEGYPKLIAHIAAEDGIDAAVQFPDGIAAIMDGADGTLYVFAGEKYVSSSDPSTAADIKSRFGIVHNNIAETGIIDAADTTSGGVLYLFSGNQYVRYSAGSRAFADEGYPKNIFNWKNFENGVLPDAVSRGIKAGFTDADNETYFFTETDFFTLSNPSATARTNTKWGKVKNNIQETGIIDAAFIAPNGKTYLFSQDQYVRYTPDPATYVQEGYPNTNGKTAYVDEGFPKTIAGNWGDLPEAYRTGIDAGFVFDGRTYLFKGDTYIRYSDPACKKIDTGFPRKIALEMSLLPDFRLNDVKTFQQFKALSRSFSDSDNSILSYLTDSKNGLFATVADQRSRLSSVTEWNKTQIEKLEGSGALSGTDIDIGDIQTLTEMNALFELAESMGSLPFTLKTEAWDKIHGMPPALDAAAAILAGQLKTVMGAAAWKGLSAELRNKMNLAKRDALLGYLIFKMEQDLNTEWIQNPRDLYEYLLIDVEMGEEATTSRIQEAIMCMQLFYHRMLMNLEDEDQATVKDVKAKLKSWWIWMKNYRVWEANRKVFLYPENYIRPELRDTKSPEFKELEEALLQGDITDEAAERAYKTYLDQFSKLASLKIAGGYVYQRSLASADTAIADLSEKKAIIFGHTRVEPKKYYYMTGEIIDPDTEEENQVIDWSPWKDIGITINADRVYPVYSFNRIFVFWVEDRERDQSTYQSRVSPDDQKIQHDPIIFYSFYNHNGDWTLPQEMVNLGNAVDKLDNLNVNKKLFIEDKSKKGKPDELKVKEVMSGARLYVTNPITATHYNADEYIYISYEARYKDPASGVNLEFTFEGKMKSDLTFESGTDVRKAVDLIEKKIEFPFANFGITSVDSVNHWKGYFNDSFSAPWFSFNSAGGSFLAKPYYVQDGPIQVDKNSPSSDPENAKLLGKIWTNYPDSGFTDQYARKHLFFREDINGTQLYAVLDQDGNMSAPVQVSDRWGKRNIFDWYPEAIECAAADGGEIYIATASRHISYSGSDYGLIDQETVAETAGEEEIAKLLPATARPGSWHAVKERLGDYIATLEHAFVYSGDGRFYLVANPLKDNGEPVHEYTIAPAAGFWPEMADLIPAGSTADTIRNWQAVDSAAYYEAGGIRRLYVRNFNSVFVKDYKAGTYGIYTVESLTHPDLMNIVYDDLPQGAVQTPWATVAQNLMEFLGRLSAIGTGSEGIMFIALKSDGSYEYAIPVHEELFTTIADIINDQIISPKVDALTELTSADLFESGAIKRLYLRSGDVVVIFDYHANTWSVRDLSGLIHPDFVSKVPSLSGLLPSGDPVPWADVAEDFSEFMTTVERAIVWKGRFYLLTPKAGGGYEYTSPDDPTWFWKAVGDALPAASGFTGIDSACVIENEDGRKLYVTFNSNVAIYNFTTAAWSLSEIKKVWDTDFAVVKGLIQIPDGTVYIFSGTEYAEKINNAYTKFPVHNKWGYMKNVIMIRTESGGTGRVDAAFMDNDHRVYLIIGDYVLRYSSVDNNVIDAAFVDVKTRAFFGIDENELKEEFSSYQGNIQITGMATNTAFVQNVNGEEKLYLFIDLSARITRHIWKIRWRWWGGWRWRSYRYGGIWTYKRRRIWWGWWWPERYLVTEIEEARKSAYIRASRSGDAFDADFDYPKVVTGSWSNLPGDFNKMITATFEDKDEEGRDVFYVVRSFDTNEPGQQIRRTYDGFVKYTGRKNFPKEICEENYEIVRLTSSTSEVLSQKLLVGGIDSLLSLTTQKTTELPLFVKKGTDIADILGEEDGDENIPMTLNDIRKNDIIEYKVWNEGTGSQKYLLRIPETGRLDFGSINGQYYWELFFHAPFLIAQAFNNAQKFDEARTWYEYIFDPTEKHDDVNLLFWKFIPFHKNILETDDIRLSAAQYKRYLNDPFDPHAIAELRQVAYRKSIVMSYIDNLIDHADMLFRQYTRETINEARMFYVLAYDLLGKKPELLGTRKLSDTMTYKDHREHRGLNMAIVDLENNPGNAVVPAGSGDNPNGSILDVTGYFYIPENREFVEYWDRVEDRLYKIRYSLNIEGVKQLLPLFEPPIDVMALVRAVGSGMGLAQALADFNVAIPHYRFAFILGKARELTSRLTQFGQSLLSALEKKDAEELALLRNTHEKAILKLTLDIKNAQLQDSEETVKALRANLKGAKTREAHYNMLISDGLSPYEQSQIGLLAASQVFAALSSTSAISAAIGSLIPQVGAFAFHFGGTNVGSSLAEVKEGMQAISTQLSMTGNLISILGGYHRRGQDWGLQHKLAKSDIENIERQIAGAEIKVKIARFDIETAKTNIKNLESVDTFMKSKFTNLQLYRWMTGKLSGLYFQTYQMALDMAKWAQKSFQFELGYKESEVSFISSLYWDSLKKGLLAGETLQVDLDRMEKAYIEKNKRRFEISKTVSLLQLDPLALLNLREKRVCEFTLGEELYDYDFPGHYRRQIKTVSLTFPAVAGPYENINATLTQLSHRTLIEPDKAGAGYLLNPVGDQPLSIRADWRVNQQIALSRGVNDAGLFQLNFQDERYLPFEGTGAVSTWRLELNGQETSFDVNTLSDVVIKIEYSALQGGDVFGAAVKKLLKPSPAAKIFNLSQDFSAEWNSFMEDPSAGLKIKVTREMFPNMGTKNKVTGLYMLYALSKEGVKDIGDTAMKLNTTIDVKQATLINLTDIGKELSISSSGSSWTLKPASSADEFKPGNISNIALVCVYEKKPEF